jgi:hypothetical protein
MTVNCDRCTVRGTTCANCAVTFVTSPGDASLGDHVELDADEVRALTALADAGMIPPLRYSPRQLDSASRRRYTPEPHYAPPVAKAS